MNVFCVFFYTFTWYSCFPWRKSCFCNIYRLAVLWFFNLSCLINIYCRKFVFGKLSTSWRAFGFPLVVRQTITTGSEIFEVYTKLLAPFLVPDEKSIDNCGSAVNNVAEVEEDNKNPRLTEIPGITSTEEPDSTCGTKFQFYITDEKGIERDSEITMEEPVNMKTMPARLNVLACWSESMLKHYSVQPLSLLPEVFKSGFFTKRPQESISLFKCLEAFLKEEPLGPEDMWSVSYSGFLFLSITLLDRLYCVAYLVNKGNMKNLIILRIHRSANSSLLLLILIATLSW